MSDKAPHIMKTPAQDPHHVSVMKTECLEFFTGKKLTTFFEGTVGAGGHAAALLNAHPEITTYIGCDQDPQALCLAEQNLAPWKEKVALCQGNFADLDLFIQEKGLETVDGFFLI